MKLIEALCQAELCLSMAEARRSISSVTVNGERVRGDTEVQENDTIRIGKKREAKL